MKYPISVLLRVFIATAWFLCTLSPMQAIGAPFAYISNYGSNNVSVIDTAANAVTATITVGSSPYGLAVSPTNPRVYVANMGDGTISVIDTITNTLVTTVNVGAGPARVAVNPAGTRVYVSNAGAGTVSVIDATTIAVTATITVGGQPMGIQVDASAARVYVANWGNYVSVIDTGTNTLAATIELTGSNPIDLAVAPNGSKVYVTNHYSGNVSIVDTASNTETSKFAVASYPVGVSFNRNGSKLYVTRYGSGNVLIVDPATNMVTNDLPGFAAPVSIEETPDGSRLYVVNQSGNNVSVINAADYSPITSVPVGSTPLAYGGKFIGSAACTSAPVGLVAWWGGDNNAMDFLGGNNGTLMNGAGFTLGKVGQAFSFDGVDDHVIVAYSPLLDLHGSLTISAWINSNNNGGSNRGIAGKAGGYQMFIEAGGLLVFGFYNGSQWTLLHSSIAIPENTWTHAAGTFDATSGTLRIFINGTPDTSLVTAQRLSTNARPVMIGGFGSDGAPFSGLIDEVVVADRALSEPEILAGYVAGGAGICRPAVAPPSGLVAWWRGENDATDSAGNSHGAMKSGGTFLPGKVGKAFSFNGTNQYVEVPDSALWNFGANDFSIHFWLNFNGADAFFIGHDNGGYAQNKWIFYLSGGKLSFHINGPYSVEIGQFAYAFVPSQWYHLAVTRSGSNYTFFVNGVALGTASDSSAIPDATAPLTIGQSEGLYFVHGLMDEVAIFNRALSAAEIVAIYYAGGGGMIYTPDTTPDAFNFIAQTGMPLDTPIVSNPVTVSGISSQVPISITGGQYAVSTNGGLTWSSWASAAGTVVASNQVKVRQIPSTSHSTLTAATLTIGGVAGAFNVTTAAAGEPDASGLVAWWRADNSAYDSVGGNHGLPANGANYVAGRSGQAFRFDGVDDFVRVANPQNIPVDNSARTFSAWINSSGATAGGHYQGILGYGLPNASLGSGNSLFFEWGGDNVASHLFQMNLIAGGASETTMAYNTWYHVAFTHDGITTRMYINGRLESAVEMAQHTIMDPATGLSIGSSPAFDAWHANFYGLIDEVKIFKRKLSALEISMLAGTRPDAFNFTAQTGVALNTVVESSPITVTGITNTAEITIAGGEYSVSTDAGATWSAWTGAPGTISLNSKVKVRRTSAASVSTTTTATLTIGGVSGTFDVSTVAPALVTVLSLKTHGTAGTFDLGVDTSQAITGAVTVESRATGAGHTLVFQFSAPITSVGGATIVDALGAPAGSASATPSAGDVVVTLAGVPDRKRVTVSLSGLNGTGAASVSLGFLAGDVNDSGSISSSDIIRIRVRSGQAVDTSNFRYDLNASGIVSAADVAAVKARSGVSFP